MVKSEFLPEPLRPYLRAFRQKRRAMADARQAFTAEDGSPILIYQMGKVGSSTVQASLEAANLGHRVLSAHFLSDELPKRRKSYVRSITYPPAYHYELSRSIRKQLARRPRPVKVITLVRDPVARLISSIYQVPELMGADVRKTSGDLDPAKAIEFVRRKVSGSRAFKYVNTWFDREIRAVLDIDVFAYPFPKQRGWMIARKGDVELLLIRLEDLASEGPAALAKFLGIDRPVEIRSSRVRAATDQGASYLRVVNDVTIPRESAERIYNSRFVRHFYSDEMIERFLTRWSPKTRSRS